VGTVNRICFLTHW